ncbi:hypothetical protein BDN72DRAFT_649006 [Pluteus cervinus]|uniref:Uncharacterized protein n=1 Tax=Pluteus cervinus TaxID=181527 RepID=A0ACD3AS81_9AGAR|nr:hypothetical protein BDN72DRAFT_649006 [Pluteus cervinus]
MDRQTPLDTDYETSRSPHRPHFSPQVFNLALLHKVKTCFVAPPSRLVLENIRETCEQRSLYTRYGLGWRAPAHPLSPPILETGHRSSLILVLDRTHRVAGAGRGMGDSLLSGRHPSTYHVFVMKGGVAAFFYTSGSSSRCVQCRTVGTSLRGTSQKSVSYGSPLSKRVSLYLSSSGWDIRST